MKKLIGFIFLLVITHEAFAGHIAGGEIFYRYLGPGAAVGTSKYAITVRLFRECNAQSPPGQPPPAQLPGSVLVNIYNNTSPSTQVSPQLTATLSGTIQQLSLTTANPCIINAPSVCYQVGNYVIASVELPNTAAGYIAAFQTCCRTNGITNVLTFPLPSGNSAEGATYTCEIPGTNKLGIGTNSSPVFALKDTTLVCNGSPIKLDFSATDPDVSDSLSYSFCSAYDRGLTENAGSTSYSSPPFNTITYTSGYSGSQPLGATVTIDPVTGIISGKAPGSGSYVVNVCITEWRNGVPISQHRKDFTLVVSNCQLTAAELKPGYINCDSSSVYFENEAASPVTSYLWDFGEKNVANPTSTLPTPTYRYQDTGTYVVKLKVTNAKGCQDSTTSIVKIYPGFDAGVKVQGNCYLNAYKFFDATIAKYGSVNSWQWDFGDLTTLADTARSKDSSWKYSAPVNNASVRLIVTSSKGCIDTTIYTLNVLDKPMIDLPFKDTLICSIDTLMLRANIVNTATITWVPDNLPNRSRIINANTSNPLVYPKDTTNYLVTINDNGCINTDTVRVNVLDFITVQLGPDTTICRTDSIVLKPVSHALSYQWTPAYALSSTTVKNPIATPLVNTTYYVTANLGKCQANAQVLVKTAPYPVVNISTQDATICFGTRVQLRGTSNGNSFQWSPAGSLIYANTLNPVAGPARTTAYILTAKDTQSGCPKPVTDTVLITVIPPMIANAGNDTSVLANQPLQLTATGSGTIFSWSPSFGLSDTNIFNPVATLPPSIDSIRYTVRVSNAAGCYADDVITVHVYKTAPEIFVPTAFTPNGDGRNDVLKPTVVGISKLSYFRIYNRWGQIVFATSEIGKGWDGTFSGIKQASGTYVFEASGTDYLGKLVYRKGTTVLIR